MANPAPWAKFGAVAFAASPIMKILFFLEAQGKEVTLFIFRISVLSILLAGVFFISSLILTGAFQCWNN